MFKKTYKDRKGYLPFLSLPKLLKNKNSKMVMVTIIIAILVINILTYTYNQLILELSDSDNWALMITDGYLYNTKISKKNINRIKVCIIDSGFSENDPDLKLIKLKNNNAAVSVGNHGTLVANIIGAQKDIKINNSGFIPGLDIYIYDIPEEELNTSNLSKAINDVIDEGIDIINISLSTTIDDKTLYNSIKHAIDRGIVIVCSSGNTGNEQLIYPASYNLDGLISVGAIDRHMDVLPITTFNNSVEVFAPGEIICNKNNSAKISGTSIAVPIVTSLVILLKAKHPNLNPEEVEKIIKENSKQYNVKWRWCNRNIKIISFKEALEYKIPTYRTSLQFF